MNLSLPITIGHNSAGEPYQANVSMMPHLFISYSDESHLQALYDRLMNQIMQLHIDSPITWALALEYENIPQTLASIPDPKLFRVFISNAMNTVQTDSNRLFVQSLNKELKRRKRLQDDKALRKPLIILMDHIINRLTVGTSRRTGRQFLDCLLEGPGVGMHAILSSHQSYKNLLDQFMQWTNNGKMPEPAITASTSKSISLGSELILSGEGLLFFRNQNSRDYLKLYQ